MLVNVVRELARRQRADAVLGGVVSNRLMKNASLGNRERAGVGIEAPLDADSEQAVSWIAPDQLAGAPGWGISSSTRRDRPRR